MNLIFAICAAICVIAFTVTITGAFFGNSDCVLYGFIVCAIFAIIAFLCYIGLDLFTLLH